MSDDVKHECAVAMVVLRKATVAAGDRGGTKLSLLMEKQHNRGQDGAGAAILSNNPNPGEPPYWIAKSASATPLVDILGAIGKRESAQDERIFLGHLRYATFGKNEVAFCHPFVHEASELARTLLLAGNFNLTNASELFETHRRKGAFPTSKADGYLICEMIAHELGDTRSLASAIAKALANADGAWTLCGATGDGWAFATRDPHGIRPGFYLLNDDFVAVASERPAIQAAFDVPPDAVKEIPPGKALVVSPFGDVEMVEACPPGEPRPCVFERIYFSRANDAMIHHERKALGAALADQIVEAAEADLEDIFFSYIPNSAQVSFHGLLEHMISEGVKCGKSIRFGQVAIKDAKFRTFIADASARREFYKHVYDVTYGLVREGKDSLVVLDDSIVRGNTMKNAILPMLDRLGPRKIVVASSAPPIRYPDCYGIDMSTLGELVAFRALVNLLNEAAAKGELGPCRSADELLRKALMSDERDPLKKIYAMFTEEQHNAEIARLLVPSGLRAKVEVVYQTVDNLHRCCPLNTGDWYFTGEYPTEGGYKVLRKALLNYLEKRSDRSY